MRNFLTLLVLALVAACSDGSKPLPPPGPSFQLCPEWEFMWSPGFAREKACTNGSFDFPQQDGIHMVMQHAASIDKSPIMGKTILLQARIIGDGTMRVSDPNDRPPPNIRLMMQQVGDRLTAEEEHKRWWALDLCPIIVPSECRLFVTIEPSRWSSVFGKRGDTVPDAFKAAVDNISRVGFSFGGMFAAHGAYANGKVRFELLQYGIMP